MPFNRNIWYHIKWHHNFTLDSIKTVSCFTVAIVLLFFYTEKDVSIAPIMDTTIAIIAAWILKFSSYITINDIIMVIIIKKYFFSNPILSFKLPFLLFKLLHSLTYLIVFLSDILHPLIEVWGGCHAILL